MFPVKRECRTPAFLFSFSAIAPVIYSCYNSKDRGVSEKESGCPPKEKNVDAERHLQIGKTNQEENNMKKKRTVFFRRAEGSERESPHSSESKLRKVEQRTEEAGRFYYGTL